MRLLSARSSDGLSGHTHESLETGDGVLSPHTPVGTVFVEHDALLNAPCQRVALDHRQQVRASFLLTHFGGLRCLRRYTLLMSQRTPESTIHL